jgi:hypothetical protein
VTLGFEEYRGTASDETPLAEIVARQYGANHQTVWVKRADFQDQVERLFTAMDSPSTDGVNTYFVSHAAAQTSLKVALSGLGGDELFGGYPVFAEIPRVVRFIKPFNASTLQPFARAFRAVSASLLKQFTSPKYASLLEYGGSYGGAYLLRRGMFMPWELPEFLDADLVREGWEELQPLIRLNESLDGIRSPRARVSCLEMCWYMRNQLLRDSDWAGMAHSLEIRVPLVDVALLRALAPSLVSPSPPTKLDMAATPNSPLPSSILSRPKTGFSIPVRQWLVEPGADSKEQRVERGLRGGPDTFMVGSPHGYVGGEGAGAGSRERGGGNSNGALSSPRNLSRSSGRAGVVVHLRAPISPLHSLPLLPSRFASPPTPLAGTGDYQIQSRPALGALCFSRRQRGRRLPRLMLNNRANSAKLSYITSGVGGKLRYVLAVWKQPPFPACSLLPSDQETPPTHWRTVLPGPASLVVCGHINLLPIAWLAQRLIEKQKAESRKQEAEIRNQKLLAPAPAPCFSSFMALTPGSLRAVGWPTASFRK